MIPIYQLPAAGRSVRSVRLERPANRPLITNGAGYYPSTSLLVNTSPLVFVIILR